MGFPNPPTLGVKSEFYHGLQSPLQSGLFLAYLILWLADFTLWLCRSPWCYRICQIPTLMPLHLLFPLPRTFYFQIVTWLTPWLNSMTCSDTLSTAGPSLDYLKNKTNKALPLSLYISVLQITSIYHWCVYFFLPNKRGSSKRINIVYIALLFHQHLEHTPKYLLNV